MDFERAIWFFLRLHGRLYVVLAMVLFCGAVLEALSVAVLFPLITTALGNENGASGGRLLSILDQMTRLIPIQDQVLVSVLLLIAVVTVKSLTVVVRDYLIASAGARVVFGVKQKMFNRLRHAPYQYFLQRKDSDLTYRLTTAPQSLGLTLLLVPSLLAQGLIVVAICTLLFTISWQMTIGLMVLGFVIYTLLREVAKRISFIAGKRRALALSRELGIVNEYLAGIKEILVSRASHWWGTSYEREGEELRSVHVKDSVWQSIPAVAIEWAFFVILGSIAFGYHALYSEGLSGAVPVLAVYAYALYRLIRSVSMLSTYRLRLSSQLADVGLLYETLHEPMPTLTDGVHSTVMFNRALEFKKVSFCYPHRSEYALQEIIFTIPKGKVTAIVGESGAGKTTLVNLLLRYYDPTEGELCVDETNLKKYQIEAWLQLVGYVSQEVFILNGTVEENIRFGLHDSPFAEVESSARAAHAHEFIEGLPQGYQTLVGDRGMMLSGGQRQRIAIARALLRKPEILIFDEATSALDTVSESQIHEAITQLAKDHTIILVAHRFSTVRFADQIVVMKQGRVSEVGLPHILLQQGGYYAQLAKVSG